MKKGHAGEDMAFEEVCKSGAVNPGGLINRA